MCMSSRVCSRACVHARPDRDGKADEMQQAAAAAKATADAIASASAAEESELATAADAVTTRMDAQTEKEMREPLSEEMAAEQNAKKVSAGH